MAALTKNDFCSSTVTTTQNTNLANTTSLSIEQLNLLPKLNWDKQFYDFRRPGETHALKQLKSFSTAAANYATARDIPAAPGTSKLSPALHFGELSIRQTWWALEKRVDHETLRRQLVWREFASHILFHFPHTATGPMDQRFNSPFWQHNDTWLDAWQHGFTGIVWWHSPVAITSSPLIAQVFPPQLCPSRFFNHSR